MALILSIIKNYEQLKFWACRRMSRPGRAKLSVPLHIPSSSWRTTAFQPPALLTMLVLMLSSLWNVLSLTLRLFNNVYMILVSSLHPQLELLITSVPYCFPSNIVNFLFMCLCCLTDQRCHLLLLICIVDTDNLSWHPILPGPWMDSSPVQQNTPDSPINWPFCLGYDNFLSLRHWTVS